VKYGNRVFHKAGALASPPVHRLDHVPKREETRQKRLKEAITLLAANQKLGLK